MEVRDAAGLRAFSPEKMRKVNLFETERFFCDIYCFEPGQEQKPHSHDGSDKVYFVLEGTGQFQVGGEERRLGPHQSTLAPSGEEHSVRNPGPDRLVVLTYMAPRPPKK